LKNFPYREQNKLKISTFNPFRMITLPTEASKPQIVNARRMVLFAQTKAGKTEAVSQLQNALLIDGEDGSGYVGGMKINIKEECRKNQTNPLAVLQEIGKALNDYYKQNGKYPYDYLIMDTATSLEEFARSYATFMYKQTPIGKSFAGTDVVAELPNGGGQSWPCIWLIAGIS
jgi:hypothetical protein